jgi:hypothetical protein
MKGIFREFNCCCDHKIENIGLGMGVIEATRKPNNFFPDHVGLKTKLHGIMAGF